MRRLLGSSQKSQAFDARIFFLHCFFGAYFVSVFWVLVLQSVGACFVDDA